jgi:hypothetical protein
MQVSIFSNPWLMALCFAPVVLVAAALALFLWSKKPHYRVLFSQWGRAALLLALIASIHWIAVGLRRGFGPAESAWHATERAARVFGVALAAMSLVVAGAYAGRLLRRADDYQGRSGFRIGITLALTGLVAQFVLREPSVMRVGVAFLIGAASVLAVEWLMRWYAREPAWLLGACVLVVPATAAAIVVLSGGLPFLRSALVVLAAAVLLARFVSRRVPVALMAARSSQTQRPR